MALSIQQMYDLMLEIGRKNDPRSKQEIDRALKEIKEAYGKLSKKKQKYFHKDKLTNPYGDSGIMYGDPKRKIKTIMACIDGDTQEVLLIDQLRNKGKKIDMLVAHHPEGRALVDLTKVMTIQETVMQNWGVPVNIVEKLLAARVAKLDRALHPVNHYRPVDAARLLDVPMMVCHTPADNSVHAFMSDFIKKREKKMRYISDLMEAFLDIPEFQEGERLGMGPMIFSGTPGSKLGKVAVTGMTGGTSGNDDIYEQLSRAGVSTVVEMHMGESYREKAEKHHLNVIITGHMASDSIGMNLVLDHWEAKGVSIIPAGGFIRHSRSGAKAKSKH